MNAALHRLLDDNLPVVTNLPTTARVNVLEQPKERRYVAHVLYAPTAVRGTFGGKNVEIIEDLIPLRHTEVALQLPRKVKRARLVPEGSELAFTQAEGVVAFTIPEFTSHQIVELAY